MASICSSTIAIGIVLGVPPSFKEITFSDSPYDVLFTDDFLSVDASGGKVIINLLPLAEIRKQLGVEKNEASAFTVDLTTTVASDKINGLDVQVLSSENEGYWITPFPTEYRLL